MSRVEPKDRPKAASREARTAEPRRHPPTPTPGKAEGDERTVDEALRRQQRR